MAVIGLDLGGTKLSGAVFNKEGSILHRKVMPLESRQGKEVGALVCTLIAEFLQTADKKEWAVSSMGICVPGIAYPKTGKVWAPNIPGWEEYPLVGEIRRAMQGRDLFVHMDSDRACCILGEVWRGAAKGCKDAIFLAVGTGIGAGILIDGQVLRGAHDIGGAIGWLALDRPFEKKYIDCGCFEYHASGAGLAKVARAFISSEPSYSGSLRKIKAGDLTAREVLEAYDNGDPLAGKVITQAIGYWGMATANLVSLFNPEKIIFGGGVFGPAVRFLDDIYAEAKKWAQPISFRQVRLEESALGGDAGLYGAGFLALQKQ